MYDAIYLGIITLIGLACVFVGILSGGQDAKSEFEKAVVEYEDIKNSQITVYVTGQVINPGIYQVDNEARAIDAIEKAGGFTQNADKEGVNIAKNLKDGDQIKVPELKSAKTSGGSTSGGKTASAGKINLNCKDVSSYMKVSGVTRDIAVRIAEYASSAGFNSVDDLRYVEGISGELFNSIKDKFTVN